MTARARAKLRLGIAGLMAILAAALALLYVRTQGGDESAYFESVAVLRHFRELDARWELDALKSRIGINANYDPLVDPLSELRRLQTQLRAQTLAQSSSAPAALAGRVDALDRAVAEKIRLIEHFKSHNAVLRNSLAFLPNAADDIHRLAQAQKGGSGADAGALRRLSEDVRQVLLASLVYNQGGAEEKSAEIEAGLKRLAAAKTGRSAELDDRLDIFAAHVRTVLREQQAVSALLNEVAAVPVAARIDDINRLFTDEQRQLAAQYQHDRQYLFAVAALLGALLLYAAIGLVRRAAVIRRVNQELKDANENLEQRVLQRTEELHAAQAELMVTARQAGMAEIATNVLHNIGNVLNGVNISAGVLNARIQKSKVAGLTRAAHLLDEHRADLGDFLSRDEKGRRLPEYLSKLAGTLAAEQQGLLDEVGQMSKSVEHIKDIVATQQAYAGPSRVIEPVRIRKLVDDALRMNAGSLVRHEVTVVKEIADLPPLPLDRHRVLQILMNLIDNAKQAMDASGRPAHRMTLRAALAEGKLRICVADEGDGIAPENLTRIFTHGFTTRKGGHGFGLHGCALAASEMGGSLTAQSDGPGLGAAFTLELPIEPAQARV